jgi:hypothetical protein
MKVHWQFCPLWSQTQAPTLHPSGGNGANPHAMLLCSVDCPFNFPTLVMFVCIAARIASRPVI